MASRSDLNGKRVLVTGASGFTGRYVSDELKNLGCEVLGLGGSDHSAPDWASGLASVDRHYQVNLLDQDALREVLKTTRPDIIIHLAALAFVGHGSADDFYNVNLIGTRHLLQAVEEAEISLERLLIASSANVYGNSSEGRLDESVAPAPTNDYAISKLSMEYVVRLWQGRLPVTVVRPFNYTGRGSRKTSSFPRLSRTLSGESHGSSWEIWMCRVTSVTSGQWHRPMASCCNQPTPSVVQSMCARNGLFPSGSDRSVHTDHWPFVGSLCEPEVCA